MNNEEEQINWVTLTLNLPPPLEGAVEAATCELGLSAKCYCVHVLYRHLLRGASDVQKEKWTGDLPATLRRNGCDENFSFPVS